jgi:hypothetical protein
MNDDDRLWLNLKVALVIGVVAAAAGAMFQKVSTYEILVGSLLLIVAGMIGLGVIRAKVDGRTARFWRSTVARRVLAGLLLALLTLGGAYVAWLVWSADPPVPKTLPKEENKRLAIPPSLIQIADKEWVIEGESCASDGIRFILEGNELVAYPKGASPMRHSIVDAVGGKVTTQVDGRPVTFLVRGDGFTYVDGGVETWFQKCE